MAKRLLKPKVSEEQLGSNPLAGTTLKIRIREVKANFIVTTQESIEEGVHLDPQKMHHAYTVEDYKPTKIYTESALRLHIGALPRNSRDLYLWICYEAELNKDYIWINYLRYMDEFGVSLNTYKESLKGLILNNIIQLTVYSKENVYWINPMFFFNGNRLSKYPDNVVER